MKKKHVISLLSVLALGGAVFSSVAPQAQAAGRTVDTHAATVQLWIESYNTACSGVFVGPDTILTAKHCVVTDRVNPQTNKEHEYVEKNIKIYKSHAGTGTPIATAEVKWAHPGSTRSNHDVAILKTNNYRTKDYAPVARSVPRPGETLHVCGVNNLDNLYRGFGESHCGAATMTEHTYSPTHYILSKPVQTANGDSGGPVYNERGQVVGITHGDDYESNYTTPLQDIMFKLRIRGVVAQY